MSDEQNDEISPHVASEFYVWLWYRSEAGRGKVELGPDEGAVEFWVDDRIAFRAVGEERASVMLTGERPSTTPEARAALAGGKVLKEIRLALRREDREYTVTLRGPRVAIAAAKLATQVKTGDVAEVLYDRMFTYEELHFVVAALFRRFAAERTAADWHDVVLPEMRKWVQLDEATDGP